jgi:hypothetical protein
MSTFERSLPVLDYKKIEEPLKAFQRFVQIVGKIKLATVPPRNHWWHVTLALTSRGLTTGPMPVGRGDFPDTFEIEFDLINHRLKGYDSWGHSFIFSLLELSVADFYRLLMSELSRIGIQIPIHAVPYKIEPAIPFEKDDQHIFREPELISVYFDTFRFADLQLKIFGRDYIGKESPSQFFWHSMDLAMTRFNGRRASDPPDRNESAVNYEAYSHEAISFGFWAGDASFPEPAFYSYTWPESKMLTNYRLEPKDAYWWESATGTKAILPYHSVRTSEHPGENVQAFFQSAYDAGCEDANWQRKYLDSHEVGINHPNPLN